MAVDRSSEFFYMTIANMFLRRIYKKFYNYVYVCTVQVSPLNLANAMFIDRSKFREQVLKRVTQGTLL